MFAAQKAMFLLMPDSAKTPVLHACKVVSLDGGTVIAQLEDSVAPAVGSEVVVFAGGQGKFMQQGAMIVACAQAAAENTFAFTPVGEAVSAENRQTYRVCVAIANFKATIGKETDCHIVDISPEGFAAVVKGALKIGSSVQVDFSVEGQTVSAAARVQTAKPRSDGKTRYGFLIAAKGSPARKALGAISTIIQRQQLKRLAAAA